MKEGETTEYENRCLCKRCHENFLFENARDREIGFNLTDKVCPYCGSSEITFKRFKYNGDASFVNKYLTSFNN